MNIKFTPPSRVNPGDILALNKSDVTITKVDPPTSSCPHYKVYYAPGEAGALGVNCPSSTKLSIKTP
jgi:hypothetical protein